MAKTAKKGARKGWWVLILLALGQFMVVLDIAIVNVALPSIQKAFNMSQADLQWIVTAYTLTFGGFLLLGGRAADLIGRRAVFMGGVTLFTLASLANGLAQSGQQLIIFRAVQGLAGAFLSPAALSIILVEYREGHERNVALSVWGAVASGGAAVGVLLGGILTQYLDWRWIFFVNVPVGILVVFASLRLLHHYRTDVSHRSLDLQGALSATAGLMALVYGLVKAPSYGWTSAHSLTYFGISALLLAFFVINESRVEHPLMPLSIFRIRNLRAANLLMLCMAAALFSNFFFGTLYLQLVLGFTPVKTGFSFLLVPFVIGIVATNIPRLIQKIGYKPILMVAPLFLSAALFYLSHIRVDGTYWHDMAPGLVLMGIGMGATFVSATIAATSGVPQHESGLASGILNTSQQIGGALGLAVLTGIATSATANYLANLHTHPTHNILLAAQVHGFQKGYLIASTFGIVASLVATFMLKNDKAKLDPAAMAGA